MKTTVKIITSEDQKKVPVHQYGNFYKRGNQLYQLIRIDDVPNRGTQISLIYQPEAETMPLASIYVKDPFNITEEEFAELCSAVGEDLELVKNVTITIG